VLAQLVLVGHFVHEVLDIPVFHYLLVKQVFPHTIKLKLSCLDLAEDGLNEVHPELFEQLQAVAQLDIGAKDHVKDFLILDRAMNKSVESLPALFDVLPSCFPSFNSEVFVGLATLQEQFLLLLEC